MASWCVSASSWYLENIEYSNNNLHLCVNTLPQGRKNSAKHPFLILALLFGVLDCDVVRSTERKDLCETYQVFDKLNGVGFSEKIPGFRGPVTPPSSRPCMEFQFSLIYRYSLSPLSKLD